MKSHRHTMPSGGRRAFTLVELLVSLAVLTILLLINAQVIGQVQATWSASNARVSQFREARTAFDIITRNLSQATLNTFMDYQTNYLATAASTSGTSTGGPGSYVRKSDLQFICGKASVLVPAGGGGASLPGHAVFFQAPLGVTENPNYVGLDRLLCPRGYFVQFSSDEFFKPAFLPSGNLRYRYRLMEYSPPAEKNSIYSLPKSASGTVSGNWFADAGAKMRKDETATNISTTRPVADNILMLIISPRREPTAAEATAGSKESASGPTAIAPSYTYDSTQIVGATTTATQGTQNLLPPLVRVVLVAIDEKSADRLDQQKGTGGTGGGTPPFGDTLNTPFSQAYQLDTEIAALVKILSAQNVNYRVFSATVQLRGAKWGI
jgi:uncharacterized protein (TIGR02599 family)